MDEVSAAHTRGLGDCPASVDSHHVWAFLRQVGEAAGRGPVRYTRDAFFCQRCLASRVVGRLA